MTGPVPGTITTLQWIKPGVERRTEDALGFNANRLAAGYWILFLKTLPDEKAFEFDGTTMRSGGREGLPAKSWGIDQSRPVCTTKFTKNAEPMDTKPSKRLRLTWIIHDTCMIGRETMFCARVP
jgi:hypothetical protein